VSFTFGTFDTEAAGAIATLRRLPSFAGLSVDTIDSPGADGRILGGTSRSVAQYVFDVIVSGETPEEAGAARDAVALALDPARGMQNLTFDAAPGWRWAAIVAAPIEWERLTWVYGNCQLRGDIAFDALEAYGRLIDDERWRYTGPGNRTVRREQGNARSYPTVEVEGTLTASQRITLQVADVDLTVTGPLARGEVLRLDWDRFDFARWDGETKVASAVRSMSTLDRPVLWPRAEAPFHLSTTGAVTRAELIANSRRQ